ncbi:MAG: N-acetylneuraminate synthase family protein, partial [Patescibacteria group bacterium]
MTKIIAELCQNHNGDRELLGKMIRAAAESGADYVKGQMIFSDDLTPRPRFEEGVIEEHGLPKAIKRPYAPEIERLRKLDLKDDDYKWFVDESVRHGVKPLVTIFTRNRIDFASKLPWPEKIVKVASPDIISLPFLRELADVFDHLVISTGGATNEEIERATETVKKTGKKLTLLHCVCLYPNSLDICNFKRKQFLRRFTDSVGWSDHTLVERDGIKAAKVAVMLGADFIERHFTILPSDHSKDGPVSITPALLKELHEFAKLSRVEQKKIVEQEIPDWEIMLGSETRHLAH